MPTDAAVLFARERYRVIGTDAGDDTPALFHVVDTAGVELRRELSLDDAKAWIERRLQPARTTPRATRARRR